MGNYTFPFTKPKPKIRNNTDDFRSHDYSFHIDVIDTFGIDASTVRCYISLAVTKKHHLQYVVGGRSTNNNWVTSCLIGLNALTLRPMFFKLQITLVG